jgi:hypothetical protein
MKLLIGIDDTDNLESRGKLGVLTMNEASRLQQNPESDWRA